MQVQPTIETIHPKKLVGKKVTMSWANNRLSELWSGFMPRRSEIANRVSEDLISMQIYSPFHFSNFQMTNEFQKWAAAEVSDFENMPEGFETFTLPAGLYAVFHYRGSSNDSSIFQYIFSTWLPKSEFELDDRPHFEILGAGYRNNDPKSEELIHIPIRKKSDH
jgi:AraC family transcriptional regulator